MRTPERVVRAALGVTGAAAPGRRALLGAFAGLLAAGPGRGASTAQAARVQPYEVAPGVWMVQGLPALGSAANRNFISNAGFVVTSDGVVVIDALGSPVLAEELLAAIARITPQPVRHVVLTHYHADHVYGLQVFKARGATVIAHVAARAYLASETAAQRLEYSRREMAPWIDAGTRLVAADRWIDAPLTLGLGDTDVLLQPMGPAHTPEDLAVVVPARGVVFAGDLVFRNRVPFVGQADSGRWVAALERLLALGPRVIVPGHGPASTAAVADLALTRDYLLHLRRVMGEAARQLEPFDEAYERADWSRYEHLPMFQAANRMNAYNTYLLMERQPP